VDTRGCWSHPAIRLQVLLGANSAHTEKYPPTSTTDKLLFHRPGSVATDSADRAPLHRALVRAGVPQHHGCLLYHLPDPGAMLYQLGG